MPHYWLFKTEPSCFSFEQLQKEKVSPWDGVRNYLARNHMRAMKAGDQAFFYYSSCETPGVVGTCRIVREAMPDTTQFDPNSQYFDPKATTENPRWFMVSIEPVERFKNYVPLSRLRETPGLEDMIVTKRGNRLSITPVSEREWQIVLKLGRE